VRLRLLGYSRQSYYQGISYIQQKAYEADIIIEEVLRYGALDVLSDFNVDNSCQQELHETQALKPKICLRIVITHIGYKLS
jgi:hypothetical protein